MNCYQIAWEINNENQSCIVWGEVTMMKISKWKKISVTAAVLLLVVLASFQLGKLISFASPVSADEASKLIKERYSGNIVNVIQRDNKYEITIELDTGTYVVEVNRTTGGVDNLTRTNQNNLPNPKEKTEAEIKDQILTKEDAARIALQKVNGKVDDIDLEQSDGLTYFLVEVEREHAKDATVQINAISGEVMSITWED
ncbi:PepSY domain-containing protein [Paenibacillus sp. YSY-4.3]